ncbi:EAL domain-containing protein [Clostridioides sp. ES-S-0010-02]|uniref:EAL domain-containing protein n=1 Tax=Clostridioides sp. ES-S-0010-02 TaxID=2770776 RepID=UPI001D0FAD67|nr:EAL domain-containing protein [Clostridioides sp. ES-S-0010-02]
METENNSTLKRDMYDTSYILEKYCKIKGSDERYALIHLNIKNFRYFNTKYGSKAGDEILTLVFQKITTFLEEREYAAYLYADNFAFLVRCDDSNYLIYERLIPLIDILYRIDDERIYRNLFMSMGIYVIINPEVSFYDALNYANLCRKESEALLNRSSCIELYGDSFYNSYMDRMKLEIETADAYKGYEFVTYLQPKISLINGKVIGAEALLRWFDKDGNSIPLYKFLPILNQNGYIKLIDIDTFEQMCQYLDTRIKNNQKVVPISFNISKSHFYDPGIVQNYIDVFEKYDIPKHYIEIEFMESISLNDTERLKKVVSDFKEYGFTCSLDDFGDGYSSFNVLLNAHFDIIKMDRQFFLNNLNGNSSLVIKTIIDLIHSLNMKVIAEGVESKEHIESLKEYRCDMVQGYYYYKPMSIDSFNMILDVQDDC